MLPEVQELSKKSIVFYDDFIFSCHSQSLEGE